MICVNFPSFRARFATRAVMAMPQAFIFTAPNLVDSQVVNWGALIPPFVSGMTLIMAGSALGQNTFTVGSILGTVVTTVEQTVVNEGPIAMTMCDGVTFDNSGWEWWPVEYMRVGDTAVAFAGGLAGFSATPYQGGTVTLTCNGGVADTVYGTDEYDWYLSQRTDDPARQYLTIVQAPDDVGPKSFSGACKITPTALAAAEFGFTIGGGVPIDPDITRMLFRCCDLYVRRIADQAIQRADLLLKVTGN
jgi:hypothetical protein